MPPKAAVDPNQKSYIYMKVVGGEVAAAAAILPKRRSIFKKQQNL